MNRTEMHTAFKIELDKTESLELPAFEPEEIDYWLNQASLDYVKQHYRHFEKTRELGEAIQTLVDNVVCNVTAGVTANGDKPNSFIVSLEDPNADSNTADSIVGSYMYALDEQVDIKYDEFNTGTTTTKRQGVTPCKHNEYQYKVEDPHSEHILHYGEAKPLRLYYDNKVELVSDGNYDVDKYYLRYLKQPAEISASANSDLPVAIHDEVVRLAVRKALENIEQPRFRSYVEEQKLELQ